MPAAAAQLLYMQPSAAEREEVSRPVAARPAAAALPLRLRLVRGFEQVLAAVFLLVHLRYALSAKQQSFRWWLLQAAALAPTTIGLIVFTQLSTPSWLAVRAWVITAIRLATSCMMWWAWDGHSKLATPATPGLLGAIVHWYRTMAGMRLLVVSVLSATLHLPPLATAIQQVLILPFVGTACDFCSTPLPTDPLTQRGLAALWSLLHAGTASLASPLAALADPRLPDGASPRLHCVSILSWHLMVLGLLLPTVLASLQTPLWQSLERGQLAAEQRLSLPPPQAQQQQGEKGTPGGGMLGAAIKGTRQAACAAVEGWARLDALLLRSSRTPEFAAVACLAAAGMWVFAASATTAAYTWRL
ncbi:hypothetical protein ABPG75_013478 [Micractinium tetrahymenae]